MSFLDSNSLTSGNKLSNVLAESSDKLIAININIFRVDPNQIEELFVTKGGPINAGLSPA